MAASMGAYETWLTDKLLSLNPDTDTDVFVSYITGILDEDSPEAEKKESVLELIGQVVVTANFFYANQTRKLTGFGFSKLVSKHILTVAIQETFS